MEYEPKVPSVIFHDDTLSMPKEEIVKKLKETKEWFEKAFKECDEIYINTLDNNDVKFDQKYIKKFTIFQDVSITTEYLNLVVLDVNGDDLDHRWRICPLWWEIPNKDLNIEYSLWDKCWYMDLIGCLYYMEKNLAEIIEIFDTHIKELS